MSDDGYEYDNENAGMRAALERQRKKPSHIDDAVSLLSKGEPGMGDAMDRAHEGGGKDTFGVVASLGPSADAHEAMTQRPAYGPPEPPPPEPPSVAPPPEAPPEQPFKPNELPVQTSAAPASAQAPKLNALDHIRWLADAPPSAGLSDSDLAAAQNRDDSQRRQNDFTRAIQSWLLRKPFEPSGPTEGRDLLQRRQLADQGQQRQLSAQERIAAALKGEDPKPLDPSLIALHEASAAQLRALAARSDAEEKRKTETASTSAAAEQTSLASEKAVLAADPRAQKLGITPAMIQGADRKGLDGIRRQVESVPRERAPGGAGAGHGKMLPADQVAQLGDYDTAAKSVDELVKTHSEKNMGGAGARAANLLPQSGPFSTPLGLGSDTAEYNDKAKATAQVVGYILEGGKLSDADVPRYLKMLPGPGDSPERAAAKAQNVHHLLQEKKAGRLKTFGAAGYRTPADGGPPPSGGAPVKMKFPDGSVHDVDASETELARRKGGVEVDGG